MLKQFKSKCVFLKICFKINSEQQNTIKNNKYNKLISFDLKHSDAYLRLEFRKIIDFETKFIFIRIWFSLY